MSLPAILTPSGLIKDISKSLTISSEDVILKPSRLN